MHDPTTFAGPRTASATPVTLQHAVGATAATLQAQYLGDRGIAPQTAARGRLAVLRRSAGSTALEHPLTMQEVLDSLDPGLSAEDLGTQDTPSPSESAAFDAMTLFALHMQSAVTPAHVRGRSFGTAMGMLRLRSESGSLKPRFDALLASGTSARASRTPGRSSPCCEGRGSASTTVSSPATCARSPAATVLECSCAGPATSRPRPDGRRPPITKPLPRLPPDPQLLGLDTGRNPI